MDVRMCIIDIVNIVNVNVVNGEEEVSPFKQDSFCT